MVMDAGDGVPRRARRRAGPRPARHPLPLHEPGPPEARHRHRHDPRRHVPRRGRQDRRRRSGTCASRRATSTRSPGPWPSPASARRSRGSSAASSCRPSASRAGRSRGPPSTESFYHHVVDFYHEPQHQERRDVSTGPGTRRSHRRIDDRRGHGRGARAPGARPPRPRTRAGMSERIHASPPTMRAPATRRLLRRRARDLLYDEDGLPK